MGVPKFFRWLSERYPRIIQRHGSRPVPSTYTEHFGPTDFPPYRNLPPPDPLSECGLAPAIDRLYIDVNGIIHGCSHSNDGDEEGEEKTITITEDEIFGNICYYFDRIVKDVAQPTELVYLAIDGVAPRAKLNQQRARRYRSGREGAFEQTVFEAHAVALQEKEEQLRKEASIESEDSAKGDDKGASSSSAVKEVEPGRFSGKFESTLSDEDHTLDSGSPSGRKQPSDAEGNDFFHSNAITPGTEFFERCTAHLEEFVKRKVANDPAWQKITVVFSGPNVPGEGEHKIMQFMREQKQRPDYNPNLRHCIMGQDGDLMMLGLVTHEPNLVLLREQVLFEERARERLGELTKKHDLGMGLYIHNPNFEFLHMNVLRDYLAFEFQTSNVVEGSSFDLEHTLDDFVFLTFLVGNDFLPPLPALDIADEAFELIFYTYRNQRKSWLKMLDADPECKPYLTDSGNIVSGDRLEKFLSELGSHEVSYLDYKKDEEDLDKTRRLESRYGRQTTPSDDIIDSKEDADRERFRDMIRDSLEQSSLPTLPVEGETAPESTNRGFKPVLTAGFQPRDEDNEDGKGLAAKMGTLLKYSFSAGGDGKSDADVTKTVQIDDQDLKGRYYYDKFGFTPFDEGKHVALRKAYVEGLVWTLKYYYAGVVSWDWFYPYHYGPMLSDLVGLGKYLEEISFHGRLGQPLKPFEQLMACLPPSHANLLPEPYRPLMADKSSAIADFYPLSFTVDANGKRWPWEFVTLVSCSFAVVSLATLLTIPT